MMRVLRLPLALALALSASAIMFAAPSTAASLCGPVGAAYHVKTNVGCANARVFIRNYYRTGDRSGCRGRWHGRTHNYTSIRCEFHGGDQYVSWRIRGQSD